MNLSTLEYLYIYTSPQQTKFHTAIGTWQRTVNIIYFKKLLPNSKNWGKLYSTKHNTVSNTLNFTPILAHIHSTLIMAGYTLMILLPLPAHGQMKTIHIQLQLNGAICQFDWKFTVEYISFWISSVKQINNSLHLTRKAVSNVHII